MAEDLATVEKTVGWRGDGTGRYPDAQPPATWDVDSGKNVLWRTKVGRGQSTPVVAGDRVFLAAEPDLLTCIDLASGKILWSEANAVAALPPEVKRPEAKPPTAEGCGYSTPTPVVDGKFVYAVYGTGIAACYDRQGHRRWIRYLALPQITQYGRSASPVLAGGKLLVSLSGLTALDPRTGDVVWDAPEARSSYGTPVVTRTGDVEVAITPGGDCVRVADGRILARKLAATMKYVSPVLDAGVVFFVDSTTVALRLPAQPGETIRPEKVWESDDVEGELFASPVCHEGLIYCVSNEDVLYAMEAASGKLAYKKELEIRSAGGKAGGEPANLYPSITLAGNFLLVSNDAGEMLVLAPGREYKQIARNSLDKGSGASPVPCGSRLLLRSGASLVCIGSR